MARQFAYIVRESSYGVTAEDPVLGTDAFYLPLTQPNALTLASTPLLGKISHGGGASTQSCVYSDQTQVQGQLQLPLYPALGAFLCRWGITQINSDRDEPWETSDAEYVMPKGDLASCSIYFANEMPDGTFKRRKFVGCKVLSGSITGSRQSAAWQLSLQIQGSKEVTTDATEFPEPLDSDFPCGPYTFSDLEGGFKLASQRKGFGSISLAWTNVMSPLWFESKWLQLNKFCGRQSSINANLYMKPSPDDEATWKALTSMAAEVKLDNGANSLTFSMPSTRFETLTGDYVLVSTFAWNAVAQGYYDSTLGGDLFVAST